MNISFKVIPKDKVLRIQGAQLVEDTVKGVGFSAVNENGEVRQLTAITLESNPEKHYSPDDIFTSADDAKAAFMKSLEAFKPAEADKKKA